MTGTSPGWKYYTYVKPISNHNDPLIRAFNSFVNDLLIDEETIINYLKNNNNKKYFIINTDDQNDFIQNKDPSRSSDLIYSDHIFLKSKFLSNRKFKQKLLDYYNPLNIFVKGPSEIFKRNGVSTQKWVIELSLINRSQRS
jgi:hypothetical protein